MLKVLSFFSFWVWVERKVFLSFSLIPNLFFSSSHHVPKLFPHVLTMFPDMFLITPFIYPICFGKYIDRAKGKLLQFSIWWLFHLYNFSDNKDVSYHSHFRVEWKFEMETVQNTFFIFRNCLKLLTFQKGFFLSLTSQSIRYIIKLYLKPPPLLTTLQNWKNKNNKTKITDSNQL